MARPIRIDLAGGWYHVVNRGIERRPIFKTAEDYDHFVTVAGMMPARFGIRIHAYALLSNHYHLLVETPAGNLSQAVQWLNVSYSVWFNRKYRRAGPLFQGRFKAFIVEPAGPHLEIGRCIHLNPLQTLRSGRAEGRSSKPAAGTRADVLSHTARSIAKIGHEADSNRPTSLVFSSMPFEKGTDFVEALFLWTCRSGYQGSQRLDLDAHQE